VGVNDSGTIAFSFWDTDTSGQKTSAGGTGLSSNMMQSRSTFISAGWDFVGETQNGIDDIWKMPNDRYPILSWQPWTKSYTLGDMDNFKYNDESDYVYVSPNWLDWAMDHNIEQPRAPFDWIADTGMAYANHWVAFTFRDIELEGDVLYANLILAMRAADQTSATDRIILEGNNSIFTFNELKWLPISQSQTTIRSLSLDRDQINSMLSDGELNVYIEDDTAVDFAILNITYDRYNTSPLVDAGPDILLKYPTVRVQLAGHIEDDSLPTGNMESGWSMISGPSAVVFEPNEFVVDPWVALSLPGVYVLRLSANDGEFQSYDEMTITYSYDVMYVDSSATGSNNGSTWSDAFTSLQDALTMAVPGTEIRVAQGIYRPDQFNLLDRVTRGRIETFELKSGVILKGGYRGISNIQFPISNSPDERDPIRYPTILSGDLSGNDNPTTPLAALRTDPTRSDNTYRVLSAISVDNTALVDGFIITGGQADGATGQQLHRGGGLYIEQSSPTISNCVFARNSAITGGAVCTFKTTNAALTACRFDSNAAIYGGAVTAFSGLSLDACAVTGNFAAYGGGLYATSSFKAARTLIARNTATLDGGGLFNASTATALTNCTIADNAARTSGAYSATVGGGVFSLPTGTATVANSILWGNKSCGVGGRDAQIFGPAKITYSTVQDWYGDDPLFADPAAGDYRLRSHAGRWNPAMGDWVTDELTSPAIDAGSPFDPVGSEPAPNGGRVNQGFDGGTESASKSPDRNIADLNHDGKVNLIDLCIVAENWLWEE
jgi:hypothetical protein